MKEVHLFNDEVFEFEYADACIIFVEISYFFIINLFFIGVQFANMQNNTQ